MALKINHRLTARGLLPKLTRLFDLSRSKILSLERSWNSAHGAPDFTVRGRYTSRGWTEWTEGFQHGSALLQFDATGEGQFLELGRRNTIQRMPAHVSHVGVHDHGFNIVSTYGNLWRLMREGKIPPNERERDLYELALKVSGAVQAARWSRCANGKGYIYSFNGPHSLFIDTMRSLRSLAIAHRHGHVLMGERDQKISLLQRLIEHAETTAQYNVYYGQTRDDYDVRGRTAHETIFNPNDGRFRCPNSQQGYSAFSTWSRGLAWAILGFAEQLEFLETVPVGDKSHRSLLREGVRPSPDAMPVKDVFLKAATATADYYLAMVCTDGIPIWDTGAPNAHRLGDYRKHPADPFNAWEPVDSSAAVIAAQGLLRLGNYLLTEGQRKQGAAYRQAALTIADTLFAEPYLAVRPQHQGLLLHSVYHRPNGWDHVAAGQKVPNGESSMWGDYHARELALLLLREAKGEPYPTFFDAGARPGVSGDGARPLGCREQRKHRSAK
jgi:unsaturated chondroitin disaccharide hydrolase